MVPRGCIIIIPRLGIVDPFWLCIISLFGPPILHCTFLIILSAFVSFSPIRCFLFVVSFQHRRIAPSIGQERMFRFLFGAFVFALARFFFFVFLPSFPLRSTV